MVTERMLCENRQERFTRRNGMTDLFSRTSRTIMDITCHSHNHVMHIDSGSGKYVTSTDYEQFTTIGTIRDGQLRKFWDKRVPLSVKMRGYQHDAHAD